MSKVKLGDLCRQDFNGSPEEEEFFQTTNDNGEIVVLTEEESQETTSTNEVEPLDTETNEEKEEGQVDEETEFDTGSDEESTEEADDDSDTGEENNGDDEPTEDEGEDVESAEKEVEDLSEETDLAIQSFHEIMKKIHLQGGISKEDRLALLQVDSGLSLQDARMYSTAPSSLNLQDAKENVFLSVIKKVTHFVMRSLQYALLGILFCLGLSAENREKFMKQKPLTAIATFPVWIPKALMDLGSRIFGRKKDKESQKASDEKKQASVIKEAQTINKTTPAALKVQAKVLAQGEVSKREAIAKAGATDVAMQQHQEEQKQETIKVIQAAVETNSVPEGEKEAKIAERIRAANISDSGSVRGVPLTLVQKAALVKDFIWGKKSEHMMVSNPAFIEGVLVAAFDKLPEKMKKQINSRGLADFIAGTTIADLQRVSTTSSAAVSVRIDEYLVLVNNVNDTILNELLGLELNPDNVVESIKNALGKHKAQLESLKASRSNNKYTDNKLNDLFDRKVETVVEMSKDDKVTFVENLIGHEGVKGKASLPNGKSINTFDPIFLACESAVSEWYANVAKKEIGGRVKTVAKAMDEMAELIDDLNKGKLKANALRQEVYHLLTEMTKITEAAFREILAETTALAQIDLDVKAMATVSELLIKYISENKIFKFAVI